MRQPKTLAHSDVALIKELLRLHRGFFQPPPPQACLILGLNLFPESSLLAFFIGIPLA
jgi:hypothetical protein